MCTQLVLVYKPIDIAIVISGDDALGKSVWEALRCSFMRRRPEEVRKHTQIDQLIDRLTEHALSEKPLMDESQVQTALTVLNKLLPDLSVTQLITGDDGPLAITESD
jgi:hypothetical protein